jgi:hypothetical protein
MPIIDADAHVIENESAWDYMLESERPFKPKIVGMATPQWIIGLSTGGSCRAAMLKKSYRKRPGT